MHKCLSIIEVQNAIFQEVYQQNKGPGTVAVLARTCSIFNNVALDVLWANLDSFALLLYCLPRDLWKIKKEDNTMIFQRPMLQCDWEIFFRYSSRVRTLIQNSAGFGTQGRTWEVSALSDDVIFALSNPPIHAPLIPDLKKLSWPQLDRKYASLLRFLLTPSLASLSLSSCMLRPPEMAILTSISSICPSLKHLDFSHSCGLSEKIRDANNKILSVILLHLHSLESLVCPALDEATIMHICHLPILLDLELEIKSDFQPLPHMMPLAFSSLHTLKLHADTLPTLTSFVKAMRFRLESVSFHTNETPTSDALRQFFLALSDACTGSELLHISLDASGRRTPYEEVSLSIFQSLLLLSIGSFKFDVPCNLVVDDDAITTLTNHWPKLTKLSLNERSGWGVASRVTQKGLITLLSRCTELSELAIQIDFTSIDVLPKEIPNVRLGGGVTNSKCTCINFLKSRIQYPSTIASFLSDVCPELKWVDSSFRIHLAGWNVNMSHEEEVPKKKWEEVGGLLPAFVAARRQSIDWVERQRREA